MGQFYCPLVGQFNWPLTSEFGLSVGGVYAATDYTNNTKNNDGTTTSTIMDAGYTSGKFSVGALVARYEIEEGGTTDVTKS